MLPTVRKFRYLIFAVLAIVIFLEIVDPFLARFLDSVWKAKNPHTQGVLHWRCFTNAACGYSVMVPSKVFEIPHALSNRQNVISYRQFGSHLGSNQVFIVATLKTSLTNTFSDEQISFLLNSSVKDAVGSDGELTAQRDISLGTNGGLEFEFLKPGGKFVKMRCYQVEHTLQTLTVLVSLANKDSTNISRFLDSFRLISY